MLAFALTFPLLVALDTLVFDDGTTHLLDETQVSAADDIIVRGPGGFVRTHVFLTGAARVGEINVFSQGTAGLRDQSTIAGDVTLHAPFALFDVTDSGALEGHLDVLHGDAHMSANGTVGDVTISPSGRLNLSGNATVLGDLAASGAVQLDGGQVFGSTTLSNNRYHQDPVTEFHGSLTTQGFVSARFTDKRFGSDLIVEGNSRVQIRGASEVAGTLRVRENGGVILFVNSADIPAGQLQGSSGVFLALDSNGDHVFYAYERGPGASILVVREDDPTSTTVCSQSSPNSTGVAGHTIALGSNNAAAGELILRTDDLPNHSFCFFFVGTALVPATTQSGDLCAGGNLGRFLGPGQVMNTGFTGSISVTIDTTAIPGNPPSAVTPGSTYYFQCWNRDIIAGSPASRFSDTAAVTFE